MLIILEHETSIIYDCPLCDRQHEVTVITCESKAKVRDKMVNYIEIKYFCSCSQYDEKYFVPSDIMDENNLRARDSYKKEINLLTSSEIRAIREKYSLTQKELSNLLGWDENLIHNFETKTIQDQSYDLIIRKIDIDPLFALEQLKLNKDKFNDKRYSILVKVIEINNIKSNALH